MMIAHDLVNAKLIQAIRNRSFNRGIEPSRYQFKKKARKPSEKDHFDALNYSRTYEV